MLFPRTLVPLFRQTRSMAPKSSLSLSHVPCRFCPSGDSGDEPSPLAAHCCVSPCASPPTVTSSVTSRGQSFTFDRLLFAVRRSRSRRKREARVCVLCTSALVWVSDCFPSGNPTSCPRRPWLQRGKHFSAPARSHPHPAIEGGSVRCKSRFAILPYQEQGNPRCSSVGRQSNGCLFLSGRRRVVAGEREVKGWEGEFSKTINFPETYTF